MTILHVDMDAFFAAVEVRDDPSLRGKPVLVGGTGRRAVVAAASYEARTFGCHSAQPMAVALRLCPKAIVRAPRFSAYVDTSRAVFSIFGRFSPLVEGLSIDEAFLDVTGTDKLFGPPRALAERLKREVKAETALTCSVGIAAIKHVAKICSGMNKPDGLFEVEPGHEREFLAPLSVAQLWGVGQKTQAELEAVGVTTIGALAALPPEYLERRFGAHGLHLHRLACGIDPREVVPDVAGKQIGHEDTYEHDLWGEPELRKVLLAQATAVADRLVGAGLRGRCIQLKIRDGTFKTETRRRTLPRPTRDARVIHRVACDLLRTVEIERRGFRLTGVAVSDFEAEDAPVQLELLPSEPDAPDERVQDLVSAVRERFGTAALYPADAAGRGRPKLPPRG